MQLSVDESRMVGPPEGIALLSLDTLSKYVRGTKAGDTDTDFLVDKVKVMQNTSQNNGD